MKSYNITRQSQIAGLCAILNSILILLQLCHTGILVLVNKTHVGKMKLPNM